MDWKIEVVPIPVSDVETAKQFYAEQCGFVVDHDTRISASLRVVQLTPPGSACSIVIGAGTSAAPGTVKGVQIVVGDIDAARAELANRGVDVSPVRHFDHGDWVDGHGGDWNSFVFFDDPDGNGWVIQERPRGG